jgi:hypothetical protein
LPKFNLTELPKELKDIKIIPLDYLINRYKIYKELMVSSKISNWVHSLIYFVIALFWLGWPYLFVVIVEKG